ncbi:AGAP001592-PB-like protein [Anopheles sinensis]|uniref:AGAP001592-PB-like protein n=1 Tax=Anopheles sinensis TaxID=74873 RepID=A0A084VI60_ANOSI|nr:AGAP001592-PB-like protein [Anopheles sinensis]
MSPLKPRMGKKATLCVAAAIWIVGTIISSPMLLFFTTYHDLSGHILCYAEWPDGPSNHSVQEWWYNIVFMFLTYFLPIGSMTYTYARVGLELWGSKSIGECTQRQLDNIKSKRRVVKMMMIVVIIFAVCWLPFQIYFIITSCYPELTKKPYIQEVYLGIYWLAMSNSMYNPIIYCWMNSRFRRGFQQFFRCCPFVRVLPDTTNSHRRTGTSRYSCSGSPDHLRIIPNVHSFTMVPPVGLLAVNGSGKRTGEHDAGESPESDHEHVLRAIRGGAAAFQANREGLAADDDGARFVPCPWEPTTSLTQPNRGSRDGRINQRYEQPPQKAVVCNCKYTNRLRR